ncbi:GNAT family N-acetyltransferase [Nemorincola caseinilytica]|uniref:GNAT family N-acetyltransferase n=2 Tax=Nemorincola caseinilytica TaxID=2054315 RepID=A0ABP8ND16_9BACT
METIGIRKADIADIDRLQHISRLTFSQAFAADNAEENMQAYLQEAFSTEKLAAELRDPCSVFYFAIRNNDIIGYLKLNFGPSQTDIKDDTALEIERIYVLAEFHGKKVGQLLFEKALEVALQRGARYIWLGVWEHNHKAIAFYSKNGFLPFDEHIFLLGTDPQTDIMMRRDL